MTNAQQLQQLQLARNVTEKNIAFAREFGLALHPSFSAAVEGSNSLNREIEALSSLIQEGSIMPNDNFIKL